ncbi:MULTISPECIES: fibronectin type III domain-containing protein [Streptomyces]|uniref:fibronectin type III domain-containing protein n=1 Tax=Streptomyces TaxID=1883 RepID=UPI0022499A55|nr:fibronectin type III domain-containing protein [Streptomyces sp. JHD 1]MCX2971169.1 fibronectin type III domain-containing protein [Streptomyces sp. JHD 1]
MARRHTVGRSTVAVLALALAAGACGTAQTGSAEPAGAAPQPARPAGPAPSPVADSRGGGPAAPAAPRGLTVRPTGPESVRLSWEPPPDAGTAAGAVERYLVFQQGTATPVVEVAADTLETEITGLEAGISYTFTVRAVNAAGHASPDSAQADVTLPAEGPLPPAVPGPS